LGNKNIQKANFIFSAKTALNAMLKILGISLKAVKIDTEITEDEIKLKIQSRIDAKKSKDYVLADKIRKELEDQGVILEDTKDGATWRRKL
jgi:cysteinyl-tRNA synthetase